MVTPLQWVDDERLSKQASGLVCVLLITFTVKQWGEITQECPNSNGGLVKIPLMLGRDE